jgi:multiple sugar transport system permease protein
MIAVVIAPIFVMFKYSISDRSSVVTGGRVLPLWPYDPTLEQFESLLAMDSFLAATISSLQVALLSVAISLVIGTPAAFALVRYRFPGVMVLATLLISIRLFPNIVAVVPVAEVFLKLNLVNSVIGVAMAHSLLSIPYVVFIAMGVFETIPKDLEEQAQILGASKFYSFTRIILPVALPGLAAGAIYVFLLSWDEFIFSYFLLAFGDLSTLPVLLKKILSWTPQHNLLAAISVMLSIPVIIFTFVVQKYMQAGATAGAVK